MIKYDLSILIPARNEEFLSQTVEDILKNKRGRTEVIVGLDGNMPLSPIKDHKDLRMYYSPTSLGQRGMTNQLARMSNSRYLAKADAHLAFDEGFDVKLMNDIQDDWTIVPIMRNLHVFDWVCPDGHRRYQSPSGACKECGKPTKKDIVWIPKKSPQSTAFYFDTTLHFQYFGQLKKRQQGDLVESLSLQGSFFMLTREKYWELNICDEEHGSWGQQGVEVACKTWLSGGKVICDKNTWYAHMFRTQGGDFGFPYALSGKQVDHARNFSRDVWLNNKFDKQIKPLSWLIEKFKPVPDWHDEKGKKMLDLINEKGKEFTNKFTNKTTNNFTKGIVFYTDNQVNGKLAHAVQDQLRSISKDRDIPISSASLKPMSNMGTNVHVKMERGYLAMFTQILEALKANPAEIVYLCEHDVIYHPSHFDFTPKDRNIFYYNLNVWKIDQDSGKSLWVDECRQVSGLSGYREELIKHYEERIEIIKQKGRYENNMGFEPGTNNRVDWKNKYNIEHHYAKYPNLDIRHSNNLTPSRWSKDQFRNQRWTKGWREDMYINIPGWDFKNGLLKPTPLP